MTPATHSQQRLPKAAARLGPGIVLVALVLFGLLSMHGIGTHGSQIGGAAEHGQALVAAHGVHDGALGTPTADLSDSNEGKDSPDSGHLAMFMACIVVLVVVARALTPPSTLTNWSARIGHPMPHSARAGCPTAYRAPSLHILCISRT